MYDSSYTVYYLNYITIYPIRDIYYPLSIHILDLTLTNKGTTMLTVNQVWRFAVAAINPSDNDDKYIHIAGSLYFQIN
jgi:hypothetical protein